MAGCRNNSANPHPPTAASAVSATVRSIKRSASRTRNTLRKRAISGSRELEIGVTRMASGTETPRRQ